MRLVWRPMALADRELIMEYIAQDSLIAAIELDDKFESAAEKARQRPTLYRTGRVRGTREIVVHPNYVMVYRIEKQSGMLLILRVLHTAQMWPPDA